MLVRVITNKAMAKVKNFCFTVNNYTEKDIELLQNIDCKYIIYGKEKGESGTPHLQGFIVFKSQKTLSAAIKTFPKYHVEVAITVHAAIEYCKKEGDFTERGTAPMTQKDKGVKGKEFWEKTFDLAKAGDFEKIDRKVLLSHYNTIKTIARDYAVRPPDLEDVCGLWFVGAPGTGKSYSARKDYGVYYLKETNKWWDSYQNEPTVIVDEVEKDSASYMGHYLKKWADRYAFDAEVKGSKLIIRPERIIVTSNYTIQDIFGADVQMEQAINRRFKTIKFSHIRDGVPSLAELAKKAATKKRYRPEDHYLGQDRMHLNTNGVLEPAKKQIKFGELTKQVLADMNVIVN